MQSFFVFLCLAGFLITFSFTKKGKIHFRWVSKFLLVVQKSLFVCGKKKNVVFQPMSLTCLASKSHISLISPTDILQLFTWLLA